MTPRLLRVRPGGAPLTECESGCRSSFTPRPSKATHCVCGCEVRVVCVYFYIHFFNHFVYQLWKHISVVFYPALPTFPSRPLTSRPLHLLFVSYCRTVWLTGSSPSRTFYLILKHRSRPRQCFTLITEGRTSFEKFNCEFHR